MSRRTGLQKIFRPDKNDLVRAALCCTCELEESSGGFSQRGRFQAEGECEIRWEIDGLRASREHVNQ